MVKIDTFVDCGPLVVEFFNDDKEKSPINNKIFLDDRSTIREDETFSFAVRSSENEEIRGQYPIKYLVTLENYSTKQLGVERDESFVIRIGEPSNLVINTVPEWLLAMRDIYLVLGNSLVHYLGDTQTSFSSDVVIKLDLKLASVFATYDALNNVLLVDGNQITKD